MALRSKRGVTYRSTFDPIADVIAATDIATPEAIAAATARIEEMLIERTREELGGSGLKYARLRIEGAIDDLRRLRRLASQASSPKEFLDLIDRVLTVARAAHDVAPPLDASPTSATEAKPEVAAWAKAPERTLEPEIPDWLADI